MNRYATEHLDPEGPGDARPTAEQVIKDQDLVGRLKGKTILITGGTAGLGTESARVLQQTGAKVFITARSISKGDEVARLINNAHPEYPKVEVVEMDNGSLDSVKAGAADFLQRTGSLHILMTNAGVMACPEGRTSDGFETQFGTNHLAHFLLFHFLKPALLASSTPEFQSRVVSVSSNGHRAGGVVHENYNLEGMYTPFRAYGQSKTANIYMANEIERRYGNEGIHAWSLHPGVIFATGISRHQEGGADGLEVRIQDADPRIAKYQKNMGQGAATQVWAAVAKELEGKGGLFLDDLQVAEEVSDPSEPGHIPGYKAYIYDTEAAKRLWVDSLQMVGLPGGE